MDISSILVWLVGISWVITIVGSLRDRTRSSRGWIPVSIMALGVMITCLILVPAWAGFIGLGIFVVFGIMPTQCFRWMNRLQTEDSYDKARRVSRVVRWLHPFADWRLQDNLLRVAELASTGQTGGAVQILKQYESTDSAIGRRAVMQLYQLAGDWEGARGWIESNVVEKTLADDPDLIFYYIRSLGETGDLNGLLQVFKAHRAVIEGTAHIRSQVLLILLSFCGRREAVARIVAGSRATLPEDVGRLWLATADLAMGMEEQGRAALAQVQETGTSVAKTSARRRLSQGVTPAADLLSARNAEFLAQLERELEQEFNVARLAVRARRLACATYVLIGLNVLAFILEIALGGSQDGEVLYRLGALWPADVLTGQWWRLVTSTFLHLGPLHLIVNMIALWDLGAFVESVSGWWRYLLLYAISGIGSGLLVVGLTVSGLLPKFALYAGASGGIMGLVGATAALWLGLWRREKVYIARRHLFSILFFVLIQTIFDVVMPQVSLASHLGGAMIGFLTANLIVRGPKSAGGQ